MERNTSPETNSQGIVRGKRKLTESTSGRNDNFTESADTSSTTLEAAEHSVHTTADQRSRPLSSKRLQETCCQQFRNVLLTLEGKLKIAKGTGQLTQQTLATILAEAPKEALEACGQGMLQGYIDLAEQATVRIVQDIKAIPGVRNEQLRREYVDHMIKGTENLGLQSEHEALVVGLWHYWVLRDRRDPSCDSMLCLKFVGFILWLRYRNIVGVFLSLEFWLESARRSQSPNTGLAASVLHETCRYFQEKNQLHSPVAQGFVTLYDAIRSVTEASDHPEE